MLSSKLPPEVEPSRYCWKPYSCGFWNHCTREKPEHWVFKMHGIGQNRLKELFCLGIQDIPSIPEFFPLSPLQRRIKSCVVTQKEYLDPELPRELNKAGYPIHFLDFETLGRPYPFIPRPDPIKPSPFSGPIICFPGMGRPLSGIPLSGTQGHPGRVCDHPAGSPWRERDHPDLH